MMQEAPYSAAMKRKCPEAIAVAVTWDARNRRPDFIALGWAMCASHEPPMVAIAVGNARYSHELIRATRAFTLAFPSEAQADAVLFCGTRTGRDTDKLKASGFAVLPAKHIDAPLIEGACANFECRLVSELPAGDHTVFLGEVLESYLNPSDPMRIYTMRDGTFRALAS